MSESFDRKSSCFFATVIIIMAVLFLLGIGWLVTGNDFFLYRFFAPKYEQVRHDTFKQSQAYNDGIANDLLDLQLQFTKGTPEVKHVIASTALRKAAESDRPLSDEAQAFISQCRAYQLDQPAPAERSMQ